jgi:tRNA (guanine-N7-)-methyltransferase
VQTFYERMFLDMGLPITYLSFVIDHDGPYRYPEFDAAFWRAAEGPRRSFSHQPAKKQ